LVIFFSISLTGCSSTASVSGIINNFLDNFFIFGFNLKSI